MRSPTRISLCLFLLIYGLLGCTPSAPKEFKTELFALGTYITFTVYGGDEAEKGMEVAVARMEEIENRMSVTIPGSDVDLINQNAGIRPVKVHEDTFFVIQKALDYAKLTEGVFDITVYPIVMLWDIAGENPRVPEDEEIQRALKLVDYKRVRLDEHAKTVYLETEGMMIDLGGIAKGYVGDEVVRLLKTHGVRHGLVNLGGDILAIGGKPDGSNWRIGIQSPRPEAGGPRHFSIIDIEEGSIVTSGDYERFMIDIYEETGIRYHHIFDPATGYPAETGLMSTTVVGAHGIDTDALSTALYILGQEKGMALINKLEGMNGVAVTVDKKVIISEGFTEKVRINHPDYKMP